MLNPNDKELNDYIRRLNRSLQSLPLSVQAEVYLELRQHLDALVAAHREIGVSAEKAVRAALCSFGDPTRVGRQISREWQRRQQPHWNEELRAVLFTLALYGLMVCITHSGDIFTGTAMNVQQMLVALAGIPLLVGTVTGALFPKIAVSVTLFTTSAVVGMVWLPALLLLILAPDASTMYALKVFGMQAACWLPLSCLAAYGASALRRNAFYRVGWDDLKLTRY